MKNEITKLAIGFIKDHWNELDRNRLNIIKSKSEFIKEIGYNYETACWVFSELMKWATKKDYTSCYTVECENHYVIKLNNKYFKWIHNKDIFEEVFPKEKTVIYFD
jgi:hypothetical protein